MARYKNINDATTAFGYGTFADYYSLRHGFGTTTTNDNVWLPIMYDPDNNWLNIYNDTKILGYEKEFIIQIPYSNYALDVWKCGILVKDTYHVIVRTKIAYDTFDYDDIGEYCDILYDCEKHITIHAKVGSSSASGKELCGNKLSWVSGFASSEIEAREKLDKLARDALRTL